jgi:hypothetical protein
VGEEVDHAKVEGVYYVLQVTVSAANEKGATVVTLLDRERGVRGTVVHRTPGAKLSSVLFIVFKPIENFLDR